MKTLPLGNSDLMIIVDDEDYEKYKDFNWSIDAYGYAVRAMKVKGTWRPVLFHRILLNVTDGIVDHINGNKLDNRKSNLRITDRTGNNRNTKKKNNPGQTSLFKGVGFCKVRKKWRSRIMVNRKEIGLGYFQNEIEAAKAYDSAAIKYHGEFAQVNFNEGRKNVA